MLSKRVTYIYSLPRCGLSDKELLSLVAPIVPGHGDKVRVDNQLYNGTLDVRVSDDYVEILILRTSTDSDHIFTELNVKLENQWKAIVDEYAKHVSYIKIFNDAYSGCKCLK